MILLIRIGLILMFVDIIRGLILATKELFLIDLIEL